MERPQSQYSKELTDRLRSLHLDPTRANADLTNSITHRPHMGIPDGLSPQGVSNPTRSIMPS